MLNMVSIAPFALLIVFVSVYFHHERVQAAMKQKRELELERKELLILIERIRYSWFGSIGYDINNHLYIRLHDFSTFLKKLTVKELGYMNELCCEEILSLRRVDNAINTATFTVNSAALIELLGIVLDELVERRERCVSKSNESLLEELQIMKDLGIEKSKKTIFK